MNDAMLYFSFVAASGLYAIASILYLLFIGSGTTPA
jgi:hypothetical protein